MKKNYFSSETGTLCALPKPTSLNLYKWLFLSLAFLFSLSCKKVNEVTGSVGICPQVSSVSPLDASSGISLSTSVSAVFNEPMDVSTISIATFTLRDGAVPIAGVIAFSGNTATFSPTKALTPFTKYTATINAGVRDVAHNAMVSDFTWSFTTGADPAPTVTSTDPANLAVGVAFNKKISAGFSKPMDSLSATKSISISNMSLGGTAVLGTVTYTGTTVVFAPSTNLLPSTSYSATITTVAKDVTGIFLKNNYTWYFTTGKAPDIIPPTILSTDPASSAIGIPFNQKLSASFSEAMDPATINTTSFKLANTTLGGSNVSGTVLYSGTAATFIPTVLLLPNTTYTATITTAAKDLAAVSLNSNYTWSFTTGNVADAISPTIVSTDPARNDIGVPLNKTVLALFSEAMDQSTITTGTFTLVNTTLGGIVIPGTVSYLGVTASFMPLNNLAPNTTYTATINMGAKDLAGNSIVSNYYWSFTTGVAGDIIPPTVIATDPINTAIGVALNKIITATFSEPMTAGTISVNSFLVKNGTIAVPGSVTYSGNVGTFTASSNLAANTLYTATITTLAKDLSGNPLLANYTWTFTTALVVVPPVVVLGSAANFGAFGGTAGTTNQGLNTVINNGGIGTTAASTLVTGFHDGLTADVYTETPLNKGNVTGGIFTAPPAPGTATSFTIATNALNDATIAYNSISPASKPGGIDPGAGELGGLTLAPGVYKSASGTFKISNGDLTLDAMGDPNATWIFQTASGLTVGIAGPAGARSVQMINGALPKNVFWYVGSAATINGAGGGVMVGTILSYAGVTFSTAGNTVQTVLNGRAISLNASVTMVNTTINVQ